jgi:hypothetical protein
MANVMPPTQGQLRLRTDTSWIAGNMPMDDTGLPVLLESLRDNINISQILNEWAILTSNHAPQASQLLFEQSSLDTCTNAVTALEARVGGGGGNNNGIDNSYWPQSVLNPVAGPVAPTTGGFVFLDTASAFSQFLKNQPFVLPPGMLDFSLYSVKLQNKIIEIANRPVPGGTTLVAHQAQQVEDMIELMIANSYTDMHQLIGEAFYFLKQVRDILGPTGWPKLAGEITGGKSRNYTRRKKRASAKRYK